MPSGVGGARHRYAKPSGGLLARVPHVGLDVVEPGERYRRAAFRARGAMARAIRGAGRQAVVVGGPGCTCARWRRGCSRKPPLDPARRERLVPGRANLTPARLAHWAARLDRRFAAAGGAGGAGRRGRAPHGAGLSWWQEHARETGAMRPWYIQLTLPGTAAPSHRPAGWTRCSPEDSWSETAGPGVGEWRPHAPGSWGGIREWPRCSRGGSGAGVCGGNRRGDAAFAKRQRLVSKSIAFSVLRHRSPGRSMDS